MYFNPAATSTPKKARCNAQNGADCGTGFTSAAPAPPRNFIQYDDAESADAYSGCSSPTLLGSVDEESLNCSIRFNPLATSSPRKVRAYRQNPQYNPEEFARPRRMSPASYGARQAYSDRQYPNNVGYSRNPMYSAPGPNRYQPRVAPPSPYYRPRLNTPTNLPYQNEEANHIDGETLPDYGGNTPTHYSYYSAWSPSIYEQHPLFIEMEQKFADYEKRMLKRHIEELKRDPTNEHIRLKHQIEQGELDCVRMKNRLKLEYRLDHEINQNISDEEVFGDVFSDPKIFHPPDVQPLYTSQSAQPNILQCTSATPTPPLYTTPLPTTPLCRTPSPNTQLGTPTTSTKPRCTKTSKDSCNVCMSNENKFLSELGLIVMQILLRRKLMKKCLNDYVREYHDGMDCHKLKQQKNGQDQFLQFLQKETLTIYNHLIKYLKSDLDEEVKKKYFVGYKRAPNLTENQKRYGYRIASVMFDFVKEYISREAAMQEHFAKMLENCECTEKINKYEKEMLKTTAKLLEGFGLLWRDFEEEEKFNSAPIRIHSSIAAAIGKTMMDIFALQFAADDVYLKKCDVMKGPNTTKVQLADMEELDHVHMTVAIDIWDAIIGIMELVEYKDSTPTFISNCCLAIEVILGVYKKYHPMLEDKIKEHCDSRQDSENDSEDIDAYWQDLRQEINKECHEIVSYLDDQNTDQRSCQETRLKEQQDEEVKELRAKFRKIIEMHPCGTQQYEYLFSGELAELDAKHIKQWDEFIASKLRHKINQLQESTPNETNSTCNMACGKAAELKQTNNTCAGAYSGPSLVQEQFMTTHCDDSKTKDTTKPNLGHDLELIEEREMQELQHNLKKWQQARRKCIESINSLKK